MTFAEYMKMEEEAGRFTGQRLIEESAKAFKAQDTKHDWPMHVCMSLARQAYDRYEGFDGEPTSVEFMVKVMKKCQFVPEFTATRK